MKYIKYIYVVMLSIGLFAATTVMAREYGQIMTIHSGDDSVAECYAKIKREADNTVTVWLKVTTGTANYQPTGCAILLSAYVSDKRIGYDLSGFEFVDICLADKIDC